MIVAVVPNPRVLLLPESSQYLTALLIRAFFRSRVSVPS